VNVECLFDENFVMDTGRIRDGFEKFNYFGMNVSDFFFCSFVVISFPNRIDVWDRLCVHLVEVKVDFSFS
jgi:hypothetical protein